MNTPETAISCLIVDDDNYVRKIAERFLEEIAIVTTASNSEDGLKIWKDMKPEFALIDFHMPGMDGMEMLQKIKEENPNARVIMMSSDATEANVRICSHVGARGFIAKPFTRATLLRYIRGENQFAA